MRRSLIETSAQSCGCGCGCGMITITITTAAAVAAAVAVAVGVARELPIGNCQFRAVLVWNWNFTTLTFIDKALINDKNRSALTKRGCAHACVRECVYVSVVKWALQGEASKKGVTRSNFDINQIAAACSSIHPHLSIHPSNQAARQAGNQLTRQPSKVTHCYPLPLHPWPLFAFKCACAALWKEPRNIYWQLGVMFIRACYPILATLRFMDGPTQPEDTQRYTHRDRDR